MTGAPEGGAAAGRAEPGRPGRAIVPELIGASPALARLRAEIRAIAAAGFRAVLIQGESGVGKEVVAEALRRASRRATAPYEVFDCPAVPEDHLESELLGTTRGAFPGAVDKRGALERAHGGTIFFDEIAAMRREHQAKILRVIEGKPFRRVGGTAAVAVDVAVIAAAHEDVAALAASGVFRHDLYYRLIRDGVLVIPPLRERREDVGALVRHAVEGVIVGGVPPPVEPAAIERFASYEWPGNVRQLLTAVRVALRLEPAALTAAAADEALRRFVVASAPAEVRASCVAEAPAAPASWGGRAAVGFHAVTAMIQRRALRAAFDAAAGNKTAAGILLGFHLSPADGAGAEPPLTEARRNLALRKFRYWCARLGLADELARRPARAAAADALATLAPASVADVVFAAAPAARRAP